VMPGGIIYGLRRLRARFVRVVPAGRQAADEVVDVAEEAAKALLDVRTPDSVS
jgi:hypothetical protein